MKKFFPWLLHCIFFFFSLMQSGSLFAQCNNADFETGNFTGWTGTYGKGNCLGIPLFGVCGGCLISDPFYNTGLLIGPNNGGPLDSFSQRIMTTGFDANLGGTLLPVVWPGGGTHSACLGNTMAKAGVQQINNADGESLSYSFVVTPSNCNFTYHYAVVVDDGGHSVGEQPYFNIRMVAGATDTIQCASYDVDATTAYTIGGFTHLYVGGDTVLFKPWSSVFIPLNNYMGQTVKITFITCACRPGGCSGSHYAYAYLDADCAPLQIVSSSPTICGGQNVTLTAPPGAATYLWTGPGILGSDSGQTVTVTLAGHYHVDMMTFGNVPCPFSLDTVIAGSPGNPVSNFSATTVCVGNPTNFTDLSTPSGGVNSWAWDFDNNGTPDAITQNPTHIFPAAGTYPVRLVVGWPPCIDDTTINVVVSPAPNSLFTATSPVCQGSNSTITYTGNAPANATYTWNFAGGTVASGSGQGPYQVNWSTGGVKSVTLTVSIGTCVSSVTTVPVTVNPFPGTTVSPNDTICVGGSTTLTASGGTTYTWDPPTGLSAITGATVTASPIVTTTYTVTGVNANCTNPASVTVTVNPVPTSTFNATGPVCTQQNSTITYTGNASVNATYNWNFGGGTVVSGSGQGPYQVNWTNSGSQTITLTVSESGCSSTPTSVNVTVNPGPTSTFTASSPICVGQNSTITYTGTGSGAAVYAWSFSGGTIVSGAGQGPYQVTWATAGNENVTLSVTENGCTSPLTTEVVVVSDIPTSTFTATSPICTGQNSTITYTGNATVNATYTWGFAGGTVVSGSGQGPYEVTWASAGADDVTLSVTENGCSLPPTTVTVTVNQTPASTFTVVSPVCTGQNSTITYTGNASAAATYTWDFAGGTIVSGTGQGPYVITWATAGTENVALSVTENGCTSPLTTNNVVVNAIPTSAFTAVSPICTGQNSTITYTGTASAGATYTWDFAGGTVVSGSGQGPYSISWPAAGTNNLNLTVTENGCVSTPTTVPVTINTAPVADAGADVNFCSGSSALVGAASVAGYTYSWSPTSGLSDATISNPVANPSNQSNAVITVTYTVTTSNSNCSSTDDVLVTVFPVPVASYTPPAGQCINGNSFSFQAGGTFMPSATFAWDFGANGTPLNSVSQNQTVSFSATGPQTITLIITDNGCISNTATGTVNVYPMPVVSFPSDPLMGCENFPVCFTNNSIGNPPVTYQWTFGDGAVSSDASPCHTYGPPGVYSVSLSITSGDGCIADTVIPNMITVIADPKAAFTASPMVIQLPESTIDLTNNSKNASTYLWDYGTLGSSSEVDPHLVFSQAGSYPIMLYAYNQLGCVDSSQLSLTVLPPETFFIPNVFTPNGDGNNDVFFVESQAGVTVLSFQVYDRIGEKVYDDLYPWDGTYKGKPAPQGVYVYVTKLQLVSQSIALLRKGSVTLVR